ncbi:MAG: hypothetical protein PHX78_07095 [bacterium]|nr:hypothetical protein [bacterium]
MDWCPYCKKYTESHMRKMQAIKKILLIYHCAGCGKFVKTEEKIDANAGVQRAMPSDKGLVNEK